MQQKKHGGIRDDAYINDINLAYKLEDGMKIYVPTIQDKQQEEKEQTKEIVQKQETETIQQSSKKEEVDKGNTTKASKININTATQAQLETLTGIGPATATKIIEYREKNGKFKKIEDIKQVSGIGDNKFEKIKDSITV